MKKFVCIKCEAVWYSAADNNKPCEKCGGKLMEILDGKPTDLILIGR